MTEFEQVLQDCLFDLERGASSVDECLARYPKYARQLEPVLLTGAYLSHGSEARISDAFRARVRARLIQQMHAHPRRRARSGFLFMRLATSLAAIMLALLVSGTVYAQSALPGDALYTWKLASENAWRAVSPDPIGTDLAIVERRLEELMVVRDDPGLYAQALNAYRDVVARLTSEINSGNQARILGVLDTQREKLEQAGIFLQPPQPEQEIVPPFIAPTPTSATTPMPILATPQVDLTDLPPIVPTVQVFPDVTPTDPVLPDLIPTTDVLPPIP